MTPWIILAVVLVVAVILLARVFRAPALSVTDRMIIRKQWEHATEQQDPHRRLLEADAVIGHLLEKLGHRGSVADKLRSAQKLIPGLNDVWAAHKLRNRIAHEPGVRLHDAEVARAISSLQRVLTKFCP